jgi:peptide deformylase
MAAKELLKIHEVIKFPDPVLARPGAVVTVFDDALRTLVAEMFESMYAAQGIGLAAPQISVSQRITVIDTSFKKNAKDKLVLINPEVVDTRGKQVEEEGCLSLPDIREKVQRAAWVKVKAQNEHGEWFEVEGEELLARALLHEIDHLNGSAVYRSDQPAEAGAGAAEDQEDAEERRVVMMQPLAISS